MLKSLECRGSRERPPFLCVRFIALDASAVQLRGLWGCDVNVCAGKHCFLWTLQPVCMIKAYLASHDCTASYTG